jgi:putative spermidine/putrescine transport system permease protein
MAWVTGCYLAYLALPIVLLVVGSVGEIWLNTLLPHGLTGRWYLEVWSDGSFRRAFVVSLEVPPLVLGFGFVLVFSSDALPYLGSLWVLVAGHVVLTLPYIVQTLVADMRHLRLGVMLQAAESLGASGPRRFLDIVLPSVRHSLGSGLVTVAALSIGEFQLSNLVAGFLTRPYPVVLLQAFYGATGFACAATTILLALAVLGSVTGSLAARGAGAAGPASA